MGSKKMLFFGIGLLVIGILVRKLSSYEIIGLLMIISGVICKTIYIIAKFRSGEYRPGMELLFLGFGLLLFLTGIFLRTSDPSIAYPIYMIIFGIVLKLIFIIKFIRIVKNNDTNRSMISD